MITYTRVPGRAKPMVFNTFEETPAEAINSVKEYLVKEKLRSVNEVAHHTVLAVAYPHTPYQDTPAPAEPEAA